MHRNVEAALMHLVLHVAPVMKPHIIKHLAEYPLQGVVAHLTASGAVRILHRTVTVIAHVKGGSVEMAAILRSIAVMAAQLFHIIFAPHNTGHDDLMQGNALYLQAIIEGLANVL